MSRRRAVTVAAAGFLVVGCGPGAEDDVRLVPDEEVPYDLLEYPDPTPSTTGGQAPQPSTVWLVNEDDLLVPVSRPVARRDLASIAAELGGDLTADEVSTGLRTLFDSDGPPLVADVAMDRGVATVDLAPAFLDLTGEDLVLALGQLVLTLTSQAGVGQVAINTDGAPADAPRADGTTTSDPVAAIDYAELIAP